MARKSRSITHTNVYRKPKQAIETMCGIIMNPIYTQSLGSFSTFNNLSSLLP